MKSLDVIHKVFFIGIGGIGMSALARFFNNCGKRVSGYDATRSEMTDTLESEGVELLTHPDPKRISENFDGSDSLVVYTPAMASDNPLLTFFEDRGIRLYKRSEVLGMISRQMPTLAVAGTHGKTTTSAILAHLLKVSGYNITAFLGGVAQNYKSNFIGDGNDAMVVEADEFDRSFLTLSPKIAAVTSVEADHLDSYGSEAEMRSSFKAFAEKIDNKDQFFVQKGVDLKGRQIAVDNAADYVIKNISVEDGHFRFDFYTPDFIIRNLEFNLPGHHNLQNAATALAMAMEFGADHDKLAEALKTFKGVDRRFTYHLKTEKTVLIEDYAHHPTEIDAVHQAIAQMHPERKILAVFQPHLYSRTRDFYKGFAKSLDRFNDVALLPIYPAREKPLENVNTGLIDTEMNNKNRRVVTKSQLPEVVKNTDCSVIVLMGAGDIGNEAENLKAVLNA